MYRVRVKVKKGHVRTLAGPFFFITNDSGIGNDHIEASVGDYEMELLNGLMVRLINLNICNFGCSFDVSVGYYRVRNYDK